MATFGKTTIGASIAERPVDFNFVVKYNLSENGQVSKLTARLDGLGSGVGNQVIKGVIYADSAGEPGALKGTTNEATITDGAAEAWVDLSFASPVTLTAGNYWLGIIFGSATNTASWRYDAVAGSARYRADTYADGPIDPYGAGTSDNGEWSIYATYTTGVAFDAASSSGYEPALSSYSWSHTCTGTNRGLIVGISVFATGTVTAVTYAGTNLTFIRAVTNGVYRTEFWGMPAPATGTDTIAVTLSASLTSIGNAVSYTGVNQTTPFIDPNPAIGTGNPASVSVTPATDNDWIVDVIATSDGSITVGAGQTSRANNAGALGSGAMSDKGPITPASAQTMQWTGIGALDTWAYLAAAVDPFVDLPVYTPALGIVEIRGEVIADWAEAGAGDLMLMGVGS